MEHGINLHTNSSRKRSRAESGHDADIEVKEEPLSDMVMPPHKKIVTQNFRIVAPTIGGVFHEHNFNLGEAH
jgi:hypothetical protein